MHCFNHTLKLSAKTLLCPFNAGLGKTTKVGDNGDVDDLLDQEDEDKDVKDEDAKDEDDDEGLPDVPDIDDGIDELDVLDVEAHEGIIADTAAVHETVSKLCSLAFAIVQSTTIALPTWHCHCKELKLKSCILPHDVVTRWNSTYYMLSFAVKYRSAIDAMTADRNLKLQRFELEMEEWAIAEDLVAVLLYIFIDVINLSPLFIVHCLLLSLFVVIHCCHYLSSLLLLIAAAACHHPTHDPPHK